MREEEKEEEIRGEEEVNWRGRSRPSDYNKEPGVRENSRNKRRMEKRKRQTETKKRKEQHKERKLCDAVTYKPYSNG